VLSFVGRIAVLYVDEAFCYRRSCVVCHDRKPCKNGWTDRNAVWNVDSGGPNYVLDGIHIRATWRIWLNRPCAAAMRPYVKLLWPLISPVMSY